LKPKWKNGYGVIDQAENLLKFKELKD